MNGEFPVDEAGFVVLPMLGRIEVAGRDPIALKRLLMDGFEAQLREPEIEITFLRRVSILGGVQTPGLYLLDPTMRLADAVALAGGASSTGDLKKTSILRDGQDVTESVSLSAPLVNQLESGDQIYIREKSWLERNGVVIAATLISAGAIIYSATIR
jgi:polysaccharide export outer membrane protein